MTAVAPPPNFPNISRPGWSVPNGPPNGLNSTSNDDFRMFMPRKSVQRQNSSSSLTSSASTSSTASGTSQANGAVGLAQSTDAPGWRKKGGQRGLWPTSKTEPTISGISTARPQPIASTGPGSSAASAMTALHTPAPMVPSQHTGTGQAQQNGTSRSPGQEHTAILHLIPMNGTFDRKTINVPFFPDVLRIGRQTNNKTVPTPMNGYFDSKVLSRQHAEIWADRNGKIWIRDVKSSNGTFVNGQRLSQENRDSDPHELREQDMLELGIDIVSEDQKTIVHHKVAARVEHAGIYSNGANDIMDPQYSDLQTPLFNTMGPNGQQGIPNMRQRTAGPGAMNGGRIQGPGGALGNNMSGMNQPRHTNFWLQPITMEQVVKKLSAEIKAARQQSQELQQTSQYINTILSTDIRSSSFNKSPTNDMKTSPIKDAKGRFSEPPAPPPQQPLPEKPDANKLSLRRSEIERAKSTSSLVRSDSQVQISSLADALSSAKKEIESQSIRLRDLETLLNQERAARESAEERANRLERETAKDNETMELVHVNGTILALDQMPQPEQNETSASKGDSESLGVADAATARLQERLEMMMSEMNEMKQQMERYRQRAEVAEAENATQRKTLAEMVEKLRQEEVNRLAAGADHHGKNVASEVSTSRIDGLEKEETEEGEITIINEKDMDRDGAGALYRRTTITNGHTIRPKDPLERKITQTLAIRQNRNEIALMHGGPAASIFGIVLIGVGLMAWLNSYPKAER
ncbi:hypothetical protein GQ43DRAFT_189310 [Delitschia confertaspora ATCC 74209]|uniref:FHA domain-containing protein n=1 Tax=Delitschia confertaspora ATCC 74209 TaxID=1513339 RepID=A0A9P4MM30_9PLEO|nr:hypothetical protein GQ43DRAFT_189310 [Delitschia confertaspora ATCC 74209]